MCLDINKKYNRIENGLVVPTVATKDIRVYKVLGLNNYSVYNSLKINGTIEPWTKGYEYEELNFEKKALYGNRSIYGDALHSTSSYKEASNICGYSGFRKIVVMYIPKGALYYRGGYYGAEYASNRLVWY